MRVASIPATSASLLVAFLAADAASQSFRYQVVVLDERPSRVASISDNGSIVGSRQVGSEFVGYLIRPGEPLIGLETLGGARSHPQGVNVRGEVVGWSDAPGGEAGFVWRDGVMTSLGAGVYPNAISNAGRLVGSFSTGEAQQRPFLMMDSESEPIDLGTHGGPYGVALDVNARGDVVGWAWDASWNRRASLWRDGRIIELGSFEEGSEARAINEAGQVAGTSGVFSRGRAFMWEEGAGVTDLGLLPEAGEVIGVYGPLLTGVQARGINIHAQIVGNSAPAPILPEDPGRHGPWLWENGVMVNLNDLIDPASAWSIVSANGIDDAGRIIATASIDGGTVDVVAVVLEPVCSADCDGSGVLDFFDFICFQNLFATGDARADCDGSGALDFFDFLCFQALFAAGCD